MRPTAESDFSQELTPAQSAFIDRVNELLHHHHPWLARRFMTQSFSHYPSFRYLFSSVPPGVFASYTKEDGGGVADRAWPFIHWTDTRAGKSGVGTISLGAHVWRVSEHEAARRIYEFVRVTSDMSLRPAAEVELEAA
jgi:hypothetical protein